MRASTPIALGRARPAMFVALAVCGALALLGCEGGGPGAVCQSDDGCRSDLRCAAREGESRRVCMSPCSADAGRLVCSEGEVCLEFEGTFLCWLGGRTALDTACTDSLQCEPGTICRGGICRQVCQPGCADLCYSYQHCVANICEDLPDASVEPPDAYVPDDADASYGAVQDAGRDADCRALGY